MALESSLRELSDGMRSSRVTDRKKNAENLKEFLTRNAVPSLLTENSLKKKGYTWNDLFEDINELVLKETEKYETSKTYDSVTGPLCTSLLHLCVAGSNKGQAYIKVDKISDACLLILRDSRLRKAIGDAYLNLLYKHVLPTEYYLGFIAPTTWEELLDVCLSASLSSSSKLDNFTKLRIVLLIMRNAKNYCQLTIPLRDSLMKVKKCILKVAYDKKAQEVTVEIMILLLETLSTECRLALCNFIESVLGSTLKFYDQNMDHKKKSLLFQLLHHTVVLHHPQGRCSGQEGNMADDWDVWHKLLNSFLEIVCLEVTYLQKIRKPSDDLLKQCAHFCNMSAVVLFQVFALTESVENVAESSSKRFKSSQNNNKTFNDIIDELRQNHVPWLGIVHMYVKNNVSAISADEYISLSKVIQSLVTNSTNINWDILEELACLVLTNVTTRASYREDDCEESLLSLWSSCVRNSITSSSAHKTIHTIMQNLLSLDVIKYQNAQALFKFYIDRGMPVTDHSVKTLNKLFHKFFSKYSYDDIRSKCFLWLVNGDPISVDVTKELLLRLVSNANINNMLKQYGNSSKNNLYDILFSSNEECILFSEFLLEVQKPAIVQCEVKEVFEINAELDRQIHEHFKDNIIFYTVQFEKKNKTLSQFMKFINIAVNYLDNTFKCNTVKSDDEMKTTEIFRLLKDALSDMYLALETILKSDSQILTKIELLILLKDILLADLGSSMSHEIRSSVHKEFFICMNKILITEVSADDDDMLYDGDEKEMNSTTLKHNCVLVLAAYCRKNVNFRDELLTFILDPKIYDFARDSQCVFQCLELLNDPTIDAPPSELLFTLMQYMCRNQFRNPKSSYSILEHLIKMLETIWSSESSMKQNCLIMIRSYVQRCEKMHYPPNVAGLIYECVAKIAMLNRKHNFRTENTFENALIKKIKGDVHSLRLYCCYLLKLFIGQFSDDEADFLIAELLEIFVISDLFMSVFGKAQSCVNCMQLRNLTALWMFQFPLACFKMRFDALQRAPVSEGQEHALKDEAANRTSTVLHCFLALAESKPPLTQKIITSILQIQKDKSLDNVLVKKVLGKIVNMIGIKNIDEYIDKSIVSVLYYWLLKDNSIKELQIDLLGFTSLELFIEKHKKWLISTEILWDKDGDINNCEFLKKSGKTAGHIVETCFCNMIMLCLPYLAMEKYHISFIGSEHPNTFKKSMVSAKRMFNLSGQILENEKWTNLFVENVGELVLLTASQLCDRDEAKELFEVNLPEQTRIYYFPKNVFSAILDYIGDLTDGNIMLYLCENQPLAIFQVLLSLWKKVLDEKVFELKVLALHAFITFLEFVPLSVDSDAFVCNFACKSFAHGIKDCLSSLEIKVFLKGAEVVLKRFLPDRAELIRKSVSQLLTILVIKKEEGFEKECKSLFEYLVIDMKHYLKDSEDIVDFVSLMSEGSTDNVTCSTMSIFLAKLKSHKLSLNYPSPEMLLNLRQFLSANKHYLLELYKRMSAKGFSEDCESSYVHQIVNSLNNILKSTQYDDKITIEACNCLSDIGTYDLKTLVTVPPIATKKIVDINPKQYIACSVVKSLAEVMFDEDPTVTGKVAEALTSLLKYQEGSDALDLEQLDNEVLKPLLSNNDTSCNFKINSRDFDKYCSDHRDGIFIMAMTTSWNPNNSTNHCDWLKQVTTTLIKLIDPTANYLDSLLQVCYVKSNVCQKILPSLIGLILHSSSEKYVDALSGQINNFFSYIWDQTFNSQCEDAEFSQTSIRINSTLDIGQKMVVQYMLDLVDFIRLQRSYYKTRPDRTIETLNYLRLEYDKVAWAAAVSDQNLAAIYYGELWAASRNEGVPPASPEATTLLPGGSNIQQIFRKCYVSIGEMDAIDGCGTAHLTIESEKRKHLINTGQYSDALLLHDIALSYGAQMDHDLQCGAVRSLHKSGMHHLALQYIKSLPENDDFNDIKYECLSFLGDWSEIVDTRDLEEKSKEPNCNPHSIVKAFHYACLKDCLNIQITPDVDNKLLLPLNRAKLAVSRLCLNLNMENCQNVYKVVGKLHLFTDIEDYFSVRTNKLSAKDLLFKWNVDKLPAFKDFKHLEFLISQRVLILDHAARSTSYMHDEIVDMQIQYAKLGLSNNRVQMAQRLLSVVKKLRSSEEISLAESEISWAKGHKEIALSLLRNIVSNQSEDVQLTARSLRQYALWMVESKRDSARDIINKYLQKSLVVLNRKDHVETRLKVYHDIAKFADAEYKQVVAYMSSAIFENKVKVMENMKGTATTLSLKSTQQSLTKEERKAYFTNDRFKALDEVEIANTKAEKESFLRLAMKFYLRSLKQCEENNLSIFRVISLWLENPSFEFDESEQCRFEDLLHAIPSRKFITVIPQLAPRLTSEDNPFAENLRRILRRCATEHPHHTLPIIFALKNSDKDKVILNASGAAGPTPKPRSQEPRTVAAEALVNDLANTSREMKNIIAQMEKICDATISFANYKPKKKENKQGIPAAEQIHKLKNLDAIPIPTVTIPVRNDCRYLHFPTLISFENYFELVGGINCPKKVSCTDSSGQKRILLIKGEDDMRQDAVMQQVFAIVNTLLEENPVTSRNKLLIRTYKVVPMSKQSGVLEWCEGTIPLGGYLTGAGGNGAHARYRPQDISCNVARKKLSDCHEARKSNKEKLLVFNKILKEFRPVFHFFFTEHYLDPVTWYERRLAYTKSVATTSMVGYIMGLGDRHVQNILIDKRTAEVIHIDFGIAFDQGKTLHTPETVPFRLTQDMIAGFGSSGVEGIFRRCCEKTMQLLRDNSETLLTILEVLLCDPLYSWTVTTGQQDVSNKNRNISVHGACGSNSGLAERALLAVSSKLSGTEGGIAGGVAVAGQVARLLHCATDNTNLCRLFPGWQPYL